MIRTVLATVIFATPVVAESLTTTRAIRPATVLAESDLTMLSHTVPGTITDVAGVVGLEAKVILYPGRPIRHGDVGPPAMVNRNQRVELVYQTPKLTIRTEGRALDRGAVGDRIRVMNLSSRSTVSGTVSSAGLVIVAPFGENS